MLIEDGCLNVFHSILFVFTCLVKQGERGGSARVVCALFAHVLVHGSLSFFAVARFVLLFLREMHNLRRVRHDLFLCFFAHSV